VTAHYKAMFITGYEDIDEAGAGEPASSEAPR
jgi:hypothetical protein